MWYVVRENGKPVVKFLSLKEAGNPELNILSCPFLEQADAEDWITSHGGTRRKAVRTLYNPPAPVSELVMSMVVGDQEV